VYSTADLCDEHGERVSVVAPLLRNFGGTSRFCGEIITVKVCDDNVLVREALSEPGRGRVLVVDGGGSLNCALVGDQLAALAHRNRWAGIVVNGCIRDSAAIASIPIGILALATHPRKSRKQGAGEIGVPVHFASVNFVSGAQLYSDEDGIIVSAEPLI
jgi:regulator of ribonuclease activity A